jgi:hypothetical protein
MPRRFRRAPIVLICAVRQRGQPGSQKRQIGGYLRGCDGSSVTFGDELGASIHPQGDGMTHSGVMAVELVRIPGCLPVPVCLRRQGLPA